MIGDFFHRLYRKVTIKTKLMCIAVMLILYPIIIIGYFGFRSYANIIEEKTIQYSKNTVQELSTLLSERINKLNDFSIQILYDRTVYDAYYSRLVSSDYDPFSQNAFNSYLLSTLMNKPELSEILIRFSKNNMIFEENKTYTSHTDSFNHVAELYNLALQAKNKPVWYVANDNGKPAGIFFARIIYDIQNVNEEMGLIVFKVNESYLFDIFSNYITDESKQSIWMYSGDKLKLFRHDAFKEDDFDPVKNISDFDSSSGTGLIKTKNDTVYIIYTTVQPVGWKLVMGISSNVLLNEVRQISNYIMLLCGLTIPVGLILINYMSIEIIRPLNLLIRKMHQIEKGDIGATIDSKRDDELGYVFRTFNKMSLEIKNLINTVYKKQIAIKDAEIEALQAKINPHFLYNTLEAINWKAKINGIDEISDMISALSYIIEANLNRNNEKLIPLRQELEYTKSYNFLIQKRFGKKIKFEMDVSDETLDCVIPKLIIQPIVENAVYHGLEMKKGSGTVTITIKKNENLLLIIVTDNGIGIKEDVLKNLKKELDDDNYLNNEDAIKNGSTKIGVLNVHRRIKLICGDQYGLEIDSEINQGTTITIKLPFILNEGIDAIVQSADY